MKFNLDRSDDVLPVNYCLRRMWGTSHVLVRTRPTYSYGWTISTGSPERLKTLKCGVKFINKLMHDLSCKQSPYDEERRIACYVGIGSEHKHRVPTRREWIDMLLRCSIRIEIYCGPDRAMRLVYEAWPFHLYRNPKHIIASMPLAIRHRSEQCPVSHAVRLVP